MSMQSRQIIELRRGSYQVVQEIGYGASSKVHLVQRCSEPKYQVQLLPTQSVPPSHHPQNAMVSSHNDINPDLERLDRLIVQSQGSKENLEGIISLDNYSSFSIENRKQNEQTPFLRNSQGEGEKCRRPDYFALKTVLIASEGLQSAKKEKEYLTELNMLSSLSHPGIIKLIDENIIIRGQKKELHLLAQLGKGGNFLRFLDFLKERQFTQQQMDSINRYYICQIIEIVDYLQQKGISHRDLKAENFILDQEYRLKLIDFGAAEVFQSQREGEERFQQPLLNEKVDRNYIGTRHYISPEMIDRSRRTNRKDFYSKSDIWSVGVLIYYIVTHQYPFSGVNTYAIIENIKTKDPNLALVQNEYLRLLLFQMLIKDPNERLKISQAKENPYFQRVDFSKIFQVQSPFVKLMKQQTQDVMFRQQLVIRIHDQSKRRVISLCKKQLSQKAIKKESILEKMSSFSNIDIKKNISENTEIHSENKIESSNSIEPSSVKKYLTIGKIGSAAHPKLMELSPATKLTVSNKACKLQWEFQEDSKTIYVDYPKQVEIKFQSPEMLEKFVQGFRRMQEDGDKY